MSASPASQHRQRGLRAAWVSAASLPAMLLGAVFVGAGPASAAPPPACWNEAPADVDGGGPDVAVGMPSYDLPGKPDAGAIVVFSNVAAAGKANPKSPTARRLYTADNFLGLSSQAGARFGASVAVWGAPFDDLDDCADLLVGAPGQNVGGKAGAGQVFQVRGSAGGLNGVVKTFDEASASGGTQAGAGFGTALGVSTSSIIAIGAPGRDIGTASDAGRIVAWDYEVVTDAAPIVSVVQQGGAGGDSPESGDRFGEVLDVFGSGEGPILMVGVPHEDVGNKVDAGAVALKMVKEGPLSIVTQDSPGAGGKAEAGDRFGTSIDIYGAAVKESSVVGVAIGVPGEDIANLPDAGAVAFAYFDLGDDVGDPTDTTGLIGQARTVTQDSPGMPGTAESGDLFGNAVLAGEFGHSTGHVDLAVTAPLEDLGGKKNAGSLSMAEYDVYGTLEPSNRPASWSQDSAGVAGVAESGDRFGTAITSVLLTGEEIDDDHPWFQNLVTVPREDVSGVADAGMAYLGYAPGAKSIALTPPMLQTGAGLGMAPMQFN